ncbi:MAG: cytochrome C oxidase subunit IV family protein [Candidatus Pacearchaeota archaeon]
MEGILNYLMYILALIIIIPPFFGFGLSPLILVKGALGIFLGNAYSLLAQGKIIRHFLDDSKKQGKNPPAPVTKALETLQTTIEQLDDPSLRTKEHKTENHHTHHVIPIPVYVGVLIVLLIGTVITVWVAQYDFGAWNTIIAMLVATIKASFVLGFFMHLKYDNMMNRVIFGSGFFFLLLLISFSAADIFTRILNP